MNYYNIGIKRR